MRRVSGSPVSLAELAAVQREIAAIGSRPNTLVMSVETYRAIRRALHQGSVFRGRHRIGARAVRFVRTRSEQKVAIRPWKRVR